MMGIRTTFLLLGVGLVAIGAGCGKKDGQGAAKASGANGEAVAKVGDVVITLGDFEENINQQNRLIRARYKSVDQKKKLLDSLVEREAMALEAKRLGLDKDPEVLLGYKKLLARQLVNAEFNQKRAKDIAVADAEIEKYYNENLDRYRSPEKLRVHQIFFRGPASDQKARAEARKRAEAALKEIKGKEQDRRLFLQLARERSDDEATKNVGGDTNFKTQAQLEETYGKAFAAAAFGLKQINDQSGIVEDDKGLYLLKQAGKQPPIDLALDKVKEQIRNTILARARGDAYKTFVEDVKTKAGVQVFADAVEKAKVDMTDVPASEPGMNPAGMMPPPQGKEPGLEGGPRVLPNPGAIKVIKPADLPKGAAVPIKRPTPKAP